MKKIVNKIKINASRLLCMFMIMTMVVCMVGCGESKNDDDKNSNVPDVDTTNVNQVNSYAAGDVTQGVLAKVDFVLLNVGKISIDFNHDFSVDSVEAKDSTDYAPYMCQTMYKEQEFSDLYSKYVEYMAGGQPSVLSNPGEYQRAIMPWIMPLISNSWGDLNSTKLIIDVTITDGAKFDDKFLAENPDPVAGISEAIIDSWKDMADFTGILKYQTGVARAVVNGEERVIWGDASNAEGNNAGTGNGYNNGNNAGTANYTDPGNNSTGATGNGSGNSNADITGVKDAVRIKIYHNFCDGAATEIMAEVLESNCADIKVGETIAFYENGSGSDKDCLEMKCGSLSELYFRGEDAVCSVVVKRHNCEMANETVHPVWNVTNPIYWAVSRVL